MPIRVACTECDKKLSVRDELAGKKVKCPGCGTVFVAAAEGGGTGIKAAAPRSAPPMAKDRVSAKPMAKRPAPPPIEDDDDEDMDERPVRKGKRSTASGGSKLWLWLVLAGVLVVGGAAGAYFVFFNPPSGGAAVAKGKGGQGGLNTGGEQKGGENNNAGANLGSLADMVPGDAFFFASLNGEVYNAKALESIKPLFGKQVEDAFQKETGFPLTDLQTLSAFSVVSFAEAQKNMKVPPIIIVAQTNKPVKQPDVTAAFQASELGRNKIMSIEFAGDQTILIGAPEMLQVFKAKKGSAKATGVVERALAKAATSKGVVIGVNIPPEAAQMMGPLPPGLPPGVQNAVPKASAIFASLELTDKLHLEASVTLDTAATATGLKKDADDFLGGVPFLIPDAKAVKIIQQLLADLKITTQDKDLTVTFQADSDIAMALLLPAVQKVRQASTNVAGLNNLKQIVLAWHGYHDRNKMMPPQTIGKGLSWRVAILPYIEQDNLYKQFKLDEPWDSAHNKKLIPLMPKTYESPGRQAPPGMTYYQSFVGANTVNKNPMKGMTFQQITDGTSNTILVAEGAQPVEWTRPADIQVTPSQPIVLGGDNSGAQAARADGSCLRLPRNLDQQILRLLIDPTDGMPIPNFDAPGKK